MKFSAKYVCRLWCKFFRTFVVVSVFYLQQFNIQTYIQTLQNSGEFNDITYYLCTGLKDIILERKAPYSNNNFKTTSQLHDFAILIFLTSHNVLLIFMRTEFYNGRNLQRIFVFFCVRLTILLL